MPTTPVDCGFTNYLQPSNPTLWSCLRQQQPVEVQTSVYGGLQGLPVILTHQFWHSCQEVSTVLLRGKPSYKRVITATSHCIHSMSCILLIVDEWLQHRVWCQRNSPTLLNCSIPTPPSPHARLPIPHSIVWLLFFPFILSSLKYPALSLPSSIRYSSFPPYLLTIF